MMKDSLVISDSNILFDLLSVNLLELFFDLPLEIATTDFVVNEINNVEQLSIIESLVADQRLKTVSFSFEEMLLINTLHLNRSNNISMTDCSVWFYAKKTGGRLLTGDKKLRMIAEGDNVKVSGILYVFDELVCHGLLDKNRSSKNNGKTSQNQSKASCERMQKAYIQLASAIKIPLPFNRGKTVFY